MDPFAAETFLCLDLPSPVADQVVSLRRTHSNP
jgi:hypothetical protein